MWIYVAIPCPAELLPAVRETQASLQGLEGVRMLDEDTLHLTVIPPWEEPNPAAAVRDLSAIDCRPFDLHFGEVSYGPSRGELSLAWIVGSVTPELERLYLQAWRAIKSHDPPSAPFPHVTVARFPKGTPLPRLPEIDVAVPVARIALYESLPGLRYRIISARDLE